MALTATAPLITLLLPALSEMSVSYSAHVYVHTGVCISPCLSSYLDLNGKDDLLIYGLLLALFHTHSVTPPMADLFLSRS